jgi:hypothetical protein
MIDCVSARIGSLDLTLYYILNLDKDLFEQFARIAKGGEFVFSYRRHDKSKALTALDVS